MRYDEPLWLVKSQDERLKELLGIPAEAKEAPLRRDVRSLGRLLGNVIKEQEGERLFETVEALRKPVLEALPLAERRLQRVYRVTTLKGS